MYNIYIGTMKLVKQDSFHKFRQDRQQTHAFNSFLIETLKAYYVLHTIRLVCLPLTLL